MEEKLSALPKPALIAIAIAIIAIAAFFIYRALAPTPIETLSDTPEVTWVKQKSKEVNGDWSKLTPEEQARANAATAGRGAMSVGIYGKAVVEGPAH